MKHQSANGRSVWTLGREPLSRESPAEDPDVVISTGACSFKLKAVVDIRHESHDRTTEEL